MTQSVCDSYKLRLTFERFNKKRRKIDMEIYVETEQFTSNDYAISFCLYHFRIFSANFNCSLKLVYFQSIFSIRLVCEIYIYMSGIISLEWQRSKDNAIRKILLKLYEVISQYVVHTYVSTVNRLCVIHFFGNMLKTSQIHDWL